MSTWREQASSGGLPGLRRGEALQNLVDRGRGY
jgi:hypothetical protein